nr:MAG: hypothetical protein [Bacteriophage sp.]
MGHSNGKITAPVNLGGDVYPTLGIGPTSNGYDLGYACANTHGKINKWSKKKPVRYADVAINLKLDTWWKGDNNANCGLNVNVNGDVLSSYKNNTSYEYEPPRGGNSEPFRLLDFDGYYHNAETFLRTRVIKDDVVTVNYQAQTVYLYQVRYTKVSENSIVLSDLDYALSHTVSKLKLAVDLYYQNPLTTMPVPAVIRTILASTPIENGGMGTQIEFRFSESDIGRNIYALFYLRDESYPMSVPIPWDNDNYPVMIFRIVNEPLISALLNGIAYYGQMNWHDLTAGINPSNPFDIYTKYSNILFKFTVTNKREGNTNITKQYRFRIEVNGTLNSSGSNSVSRYYNAEFVTGIDMNPMTSDIILSGKETKTVYVTVGSAFEDFVTGTSKMVRVNLQAQQSGKNQWTNLSMRAIFIKSSSMMS